jgi:hypothetical protein
MKIAMLIANTVRAAERLAGEACRLTQGQGVAEWHSKTLYISSVSDLGRGGFRELGRDRRLRPETMLAPAHTSDAWRPHVAESRRRAPDED